MYWPEDDKTLVETHSHDIYIYKPINTCVDDSCILNQKYKGLQIIIVRSYDYNWYN